MTDLFYAVLKASFHGSIVILAVIALRFLLKKAPKSLFCLLWLLAGARLVLPFEIQSDLSLQPRLEAPEISIRAEATVQDILIENPEEEPLDVPSDPVQTPDLPENYENIQHDSFLYKVEDGTITGPLTWTDIAANLWLLGMGAMFASGVFSYWKLKRRVREAYRIENGCFECPGLETAFVLGFFSPKIYLPTGLAEQEKQFIYDHENTHVVRRDHWQKLLGYCVLALHWFNPLVWLAYHLLCRDIEMACDEHVVRSMNLGERKAYSAALLNCGSHRAGIAACPVAFGESNPKRRIMNVLNYKKPGFWISLLAVIAFIFVAVCLMTSPESEQHPEAPDTNPWNLEMQVADVTPTGLQVKFIQTGIFPGSDRAQLMYGTEYTLERQVDGQWVEVEKLPQENAIGWATVAYLIEWNSTNAHNVNWEWLYGALPTGHYRIGKTVTLDYTLDEDEKQTFYAEFVVFEDSAWNMEKTGEEYLAMCRDAVAEFQSRESYHISETLVYSINEKEDSRDYCAYWRDGKDWMRESYATKKRENTDVLYYEGELYLRRQAEAGWSKIDGGAGYDRVWLEWLNWDAQQIVFTHAEPVEDMLHVFVTVKATPPTVGWEDVEEYMLGFFFDRSGRMTSALMGCSREEIGFMSDLRFENTPEANIREKLDAMAAERFVMPISCTDPECTDTSHDHYGIACTVEGCTNPDHHHDDDHH